MFTRRLSSAALCAILFYLSSASANQSVPSLPPIEIKTAAIEVVKFQKTENGYLLHIKNVSSKEIVGLNIYTLSKAGIAKSRILIPVRRTESVLTP